MKRWHFLFSLCLFFFAHSSFADLTSSYQFNGNGNWSIDGAGNNDSAGYDLQASVPSGSTVEAAFLYTSRTPSGTSSPTITFDGTVLDAGDWTAQGNNPGPNLQAYRADVTAQVAATVTGGGTFTFSVTEGALNGTTDGSVLVVVYSNPAEEERTIALLDGFSASSGDQSSINLADPLSAEQLADPNFEALLSLGIGFSAQPGQESLVDVNGQRMTSSAGGHDDGVRQNGGLITVGDTFGDDFSTNPDPFALSDITQTVDDEAYSLLPFLNVGDTSIVLDTLNPSLDDNIFLAAINITAVAGVDRPPPTENVPLPGSLSLLMLGMGGLVFLRRRPVL